MARIVRGQVLSLREKEFIEASRAMGASQLADHLPRAAPEPDRADHRLRLDPDPAGDPLRGGALVPRRRRHRPAELGPDDRRRHPDLHATPGGTCSSPASRCCSPCSPSTSSATRCRTRSTRDAKEELDETELTDPIHNRKDRRCQPSCDGCLRSGAIVALALTVSACGDDDDDSTTASSASRGESEFPPPTEAPADAQEGGDLTVIAASDVDYIDPGAAVLPVHLHGHLGDPDARSRR